MIPEERIERIEKALERHIEFVGTQIEKQNVGIRDLVIVSRTLVDAQTRTDAQIKELSEKLNALIDTVDKIIRQGRNGHEKQP